MYSTSSTVPCTVIAERAHAVRSTVAVRAPGGMAPVRPRRAPGAVPVAERGARAGYSTEGVDQE
eukprot:COSAG02_NODE_773_length_17343_cov_61.240373_14_plen_64_part_00